MDVWNNLTFRLGDKDYWDSCKVQFYVSNQLQSAFVWYDGNTYGEYLEPVEVTAAQNPDSVASTGSATAPTSPNRWLFSGKESQSFLPASIPLLDFGARMYDRPPHDGPRRIHSRRSTTSSARTPTISEH